MNRYANAKLLVPIDFSEEADGALDAALEIAATGEQITAVHVAPPIGSFEPGVVYIATDAERTETLLHSIHRRYTDPKYRGVKFEILFGDPGHEIADYAKIAGTGLIVMPSHGRTGLAHLLMGSVAERVIRLAHCPVLVLRS
jgi:nucleotide-binding universal stress UspA family protein